MSVSDNSTEYWCVLRSMSPEIWWTRLPSLFGPIVRRGPGRISEGTLVNHASKEVRVPSERRREERSHPLRVGNATMSGDVWPVRAR